MAIKVKLDKWFAFRDQKYKQVAIEWCQDNDIEFE
jgi:hypothetical protein